MKDSQIVELYWQRSERAVLETQKKYGCYCIEIARRLLGREEDAEECVNDVYQACWNSIPPNRPENLRTYAGKLTRRISMKRWRSWDAQKRGGGEIALSLEELGDCVPDGHHIDEALAAKALVQTINSFLMGLSVQERRAFVLRYWHGYTIQEIGKICGFSKSKVESMLHRMREKLRKKLQEEGYFEGR